MIAQNSSGTQRSATSTSKTSNYSFIINHDFATFRFTPSKNDQLIPLRKNMDLSSAHILKGYAFVSAKPKLVLFNNVKNCF